MQLLQAWVDLFTHRITFYCIYILGKPSYNCFKTINGNKLGIQHFTAECWVSWIRIESPCHCEETVQERGGAEVRGTPLSISVNVRKCSTVSANVSWSKAKQKTKQSKSKGPPPSVSVDVCKCSTQVDWQTYRGAKQSKNQSKVRLLLWGTPSLHLC